MFGFQRGSGNGNGWFARHMNAAPIAVDFGRSSVRLLQLGPAGGAYRCQAAAEIPGVVFDGNGPRFEPAPLLMRLAQEGRGLADAGA